MNPSAHHPLGFRSTNHLGRFGRLVADSAALASLGYVSTVGVAWLRYGHASAGRAEENDALLDRFMPTYEIVERHHVRVAAPAELTLAAAAESDLQASTIVRTIFKARELVLGADPASTQRPRGLLAEVKSLGWSVLAEVPGREIVVGAVTQPWLPNVVFQGLPADAFKAFSEPSYVKIAWTLRADPVTPTESIYRTETRAVTTDAVSRSKFRWYWARFSPGIVVIRRAMLSVVRQEAERRARAALKA